MNRDIKFRAWDKQQNVMHYRVGISYDAPARRLAKFESKKSMVAASRKSPKLEYQLLTINPNDSRCNFELMQYTALKDKNGQEIYEGDVIKWGDHCGWCHENPVRIAEVKFDPDIQFHSQVGVFKFGQFAYQDTNKHIEVIGNIYENPELIDSENLEA